METTKTLPIYHAPRAANPFLALVRAFSAELLKMKRSLALWLTLAAPLVITGLQIAVFLDGGDRFLVDEPDVWITITIQALVYWSLLMQPLFITLETALVAQLDHTGDHWKHLFSLPIPRWTIYTAKQGICAILIAISVAAQFLYTILSGFLFKQLHPGLGFEQPVPLGEMAWIFLLTYLSSWLILSLHTWVAHNWRSFVVASGFGIFMTIAGVMIINSDYAGYYPWTLSGVVIHNIQEGLPYLNLVSFSMLAALLIFLAGCFLFVRRDVL